MIYQRHQSYSPENNECRRIRSNQAKLSEEGCYFRSLRARGASRSLQSRFLVALKQTPPITTRLETDTVNPVRGNSNLPKIERRQANYLQHQDLFSLWQRKRKLPFLRPFSISSRCKLSCSCSSPARNEHFKHADKSENLSRVWFIFVTGFSWQQEMDKMDLELQRNEFHEAFTKERQRKKREH